MPKERIGILNARVDKVTSNEALEDIKIFLSSSAGHYLITLNPEMIMRAQKDSRLLEAINNADLTIADGTGILIAADFLSKKKFKFLPDLINLIFLGFDTVLFPKKIRNILPERISGIDLIYKICESDFIKTKKIYLIGAEKGIAEKAKAVLEKRYPEISIVGAEEGIKKNSNPTPQDSERLIERINIKSPDIIFVAFGVPKQEKWIRENLKKLPSVRLAMGVGGSFDFICGKIPRAPKIMRGHGLEWVWRLVNEPKRIKRIFSATIGLCWLIFWSKKDKIKR